MADEILNANDEAFDDPIALEDQVIDDDLVLQRYNSQLPPSYRGALDAERKLLIRALHVLVNAITNPTSNDTSQVSSDGSSTETNGDLVKGADSAGPNDEYVAEGYQHEIERDFAALEKGISRYLDLKHSFDSQDYPIFFDAVLRGALTPNLDMGLRSKLARSASRLMSKRYCQLPSGAPWRRIVDQIVDVHINCIDGTTFTGKDVRESHCRNFLSLLGKCRLFLAPDDSAQKMWEQYSEKIHSIDSDIQFQHLLLLTYILPTQGDSWSGWVKEGMELWQLYESSGDWDAIWMTFMSRIARHQPCLHDWTEYLPWIYTRIEDSCCLPLGAMSPQGSIDRRCPSHLFFLMDLSVIPVAARFCIYSLSPKYPAALHFLKRFFALVANYFHPSNSGRWCNTLGPFVSNLTASLVARITEERHATKAGKMDRIIGDREIKGVAPAEHRISEEIIQELLDMLLPLIDLGLYSKAHSMSIQSASSARDLAIIQPQTVIPPLLQKASEGLESISSPHRTTAALRLLSALTPVFLDTQIFPEGYDYLQEALQLTLPGIDPNDPGKTESTLRFIGGASARIQGVVNMNSSSIPEAFFDDYMQQLLERVFSLLDSLEAPPKKNPNGGYGGAQPLSYIIFAVAMKNLFVALPPNVAISAAKKIVKQLTGAACSNAMKYYGTLVRTACAVLSNASNVSAINIFIPPLLDQLLEEDVKDKKFALTSVGDDELVWRIRMLAQSCRYCGSGIDAYVDKIMKVVELAFEVPERAIYKAGGRLLRGLLEGVTAIQMKFDVGNGDESDTSESANGDVYKLSWKVPDTVDWKLAEDILSKFVDRIESACPISESSDAEEIMAQRDVIFRVLRMLHAAQRGGRWLLAGAMPKHFQVLEKYTDETVSLPKKDAKLILKRPVAAGLGGERTVDGNGNEFANKLWTRIYRLAYTIMTTVTTQRPDDGALLYRCLEPLELAHEPFRHGAIGRNTIEAARSYKAAYRQVIAAKRPFGSQGGVGRAMPRFIIKLRIEAHHSMRLTAAARGGMTNMKLCEDLVDKLTNLSLNDFPRVRGEARGILTRALRIIRPQIRRKEITRIIAVLRSSVSKSEQNKLEQADKDESGDAVMNDVADNVNVLEKKKEDDDVMYEKMIGASHVLRSSAAAPMIMRDTRLFSEVMRAFLEAMPKAERPDAAGSVANLFARMSSLIRPLGIDTIRIVGTDLVTVPYVETTAIEEKSRKLRLDAYNELNEYLLNMLLVDKTSNKDEPAKENGKAKDTVVNGKSNSEDKKLEQKGEAHWRVQSLVAMLLLILIREDREPTAEVAEFFMRAVVSDVVALRHISSRAVSLILALHGRKAGVSHESVDSNDPDGWSSKGKESVAVMGRIVCDQNFAEKVVHTLALDHDEDSDGGPRRGGDLFAMLMFSRISDGEACWTNYGGKSWPTSWTPRSGDSLSLVRIRFYEGLIRVYGVNMIQALLPCVRDLVRKLEDKEEKIISGVKDEDVRVIAAELLAAICRGLDLPKTKNMEAKKIEEELFSLVKTLLNDMTGPLGSTNGGALIRMIGTADSFTVGPGIMRKILDWQLESKPIIVEMGNGPHAHLQARRLRFIQSCIADAETENDEIMVTVVKNVVDDLLGEVGLNHELKTVREEVGRLMASLSVNVGKSNTPLFDKSLATMSDRLIELETKAAQSTEGESEESDDTKAEDEKEVFKKSRSRQGETLSRFVSIIYWNGRARMFEPFIAKVMPSLFRSFDESDQERISHSKIALSLAAQGCFKESTIQDMIQAAEDTVQDRRWKVRGSVLGFLQIFSFCSLFLASEESLGRVRMIVFKLLGDSQLEVRQSAAAAFVTMIRDAEDCVVRDLRDKCLKALKETSWRGTRRNKKKSKVVLEGEKLFKRHGAVLGLSSMVTCNPYSVPEWMPSVLVALSDCVNDPPPICTGVRTLFGDFMRTHRDEWQTHKLAFSPDELDIVSELLVSPSYYA